MTEAAGARTFQAGGDAYDRYMGRYARELAPALARAAGIEPPARALDVGCGPGGLTGHLVELLGAGNVAAADPSEPFAAACRSRYPGVRVEVAAAEALPFADGEFDAALAQLVVQFMTDARAGLGEMMRVTRAGGVVAACTWDYREGMRMLRTYWTAALAVDPGTPDEAALMPYSTQPELDSLFREAGLREVESSALDVGAGYAGFDDFWEPFTLGIGPAGAHCVSLGEDARAAVREECRRLLGDPQGPFRLPARAWFARGAV